MDNCSQDGINNRNRYMQQLTADTAVARRGHMWGLMIPCCMQSAPLQSRVKLIPQFLPSFSFGDIQVHSS